MYIGMHRPRINWNWVIWPTVVIWMVGVSWMLVIEGVTSLVIEGVTSSVVIEGDRRCHIFRKLGEKLPTRSGRAGLAGALGLEVLEGPVAELVPLGDVECEDG